MFTELSNNLKEEKQHEAKRTRKAMQSPTPSTEDQHDVSPRRFCMIQEGKPSKAKQYTYTLQTRVTENLNTMKIYQLSGAETSITFSQSDHPSAVPRPGHAPWSSTPRSGAMTWKKFSWTEAVA